MPSRRIPSACPGWRRQHAPGVGTAGAGRLAAGCAGRRGDGHRRFADLGPAPDTEAVPAGQVYTAVAKQFAALGARNFLFETLSSDAGLLDVVGAIKAEVPDAFVLVSFAVLPDGYTREGMYCKDLARRMQESGIVDAVGLNCVSAPGAMRTLAKQLGGTLPLSIMPNAGYPIVTRTQVKYQAGRSTLQGSWAVWPPRARFRSWAAAAALPLPTLPHCGRSWTACPWWKKRLRQKSFPP